MAFHVVPFGQTIAFFDGADLRPQVTGKEAAIVLAGLHHQGKVSQLPSPFVDVQAIEIVFEDASDGFPRLVALSSVDIHQDVKGVGQDVAAAGAAVDEGQVLGLEAGIVGFEHIQFGGNGSFLGRIRNVIVPLSL